jgi:hypothetical protein
LVNVDEIVEEVGIVFWLCWMGLMKAEFILNDIIYKINLR